MRLPNDTTDRLAYLHPPIYPDPDAYGVDSWAAMLRDPVVSSALECLLDRVADAELTLDPQPGTPPLLAQHLADQLRDADAPAALRRAASAAWRGLAAHEIIWDRGPSGRWRLAALLDLSPDIVALELDDSMTTVGVRLLPTGAQPISVPARRIWLHVHDGDRSHPAGRSLLSPAIRPYTMRSDLLKLWGRATRRSGLPIPIITYPASMSQAQIDALLTSMDTLETDGAAAVPDTVAVQWQMPNYATTVGYAEALAYADSQVRAAIQLDDTRGTVIGRVPSTTVQDTADSTSLTTRVRRIQRELAASLQAQVIVPLAAALAPGAPPPIARLAPPVPPPPPAAPLPAAPAGPAGRPGQP